MVNGEKLCAGYSGAQTQRFFDAQVFPQNALITNPKYVKQERPKDKTMNAGGFIDIINID